jgi:hypothetical protein
METKYQTGEVEILLEGSKDLAKEQFKKNEYGLTGL